MKDVILTVRVTPATKKHLTLLARKDDRPLGSLVRQILDAVVATGAYPMPEGK